MILQNKTARNRRTAFTLMEMLVVVAIIVALAGIGGFFLINQLVQTQRDTVKLQARGPLTDAVKTFYVRHSYWPESLDQLLQADNKGPAILEDADSLKSPWYDPATGAGKYEYDKNGPNNGGRRPDIWAVDPKDGSKVGNWPDNQQ